MMAQPPSLSLQSHFASSKLLSVGFSFLFLSLSLPSPSFPFLFLVLLVWKATVLRGLHILLAGQWLPEDGVHG